MRSPCSPGQRRWTSQAAVLLAASLIGFLLPATAFANERDTFREAIAKGPVLGAIVALGAGLLTAATPCVYPMVVLTVSVFGAREAKSRREAALLSTAFVLGIVALFTPLLVGAALGGKLFSSWLANRWVTLGLVVVFATLAMSMFGAFEIVLPSSITQRLSRVGGLGYQGAFMLGLVSALIATPCTGPVLGSILVWVGTTRDVLLGSVVGASYAIGLGLPFWLVGTFAMGLPKSGRWMLYVKSFFGITTLIVALSYLRNAFPALKALARPERGFLVGTALTAALGIVLGALHLEWDGSLAVRARKVLGISLAVVGGFLFWTASSLPKASLVWERAEGLALTRAREEKRPMIIDFTADWCAKCQDIAKETFADPRVQKKATDGKFVTLQVDATHDEDPTVDIVKEKYKVISLPTVIVIDSAGVERVRFREFVGPEAFLSALDTVH